MARQSSRKPPSKKSKTARVLNSRVVFRGPVFHITSEKVKEPSGVVARRDIVRHPGSVVIMAVDDSGVEPRVLLARQYRYAAQDAMWELPAGRIDAGEPELEAAKRELAEETGITAEKWKRVLFFYVSPGFLDETMAIYLARGLTRGVARPEDDEVIASRFFSLSAAVRLIKTGKIRDAKTIAGVLWLDRVQHASHPQK